MRGKRRIPAHRNFPEPPEIDQGLSCTTANAQTHSHTSGEPVNTIVMDYGAIAGGTRMQVLLDGVAVDLNDLIASGEATLSTVTGLNPFSINSSGVLVGTGNGGTANVGRLELNLNQPFTTISFASTADPNGYLYELLVDDATVICFASGTMITTQSGVVPVEKLSAGDMVLTMDNGCQPIRWIGATTVSVETLAANPNLRPIRIRAGALGANSPEADLIVSPQHRILVQSKIARRMFGENESLIAAKHLTAIDGIDVVDECTAPVEYFHFLCDEHQVVFSNGVPSESLYTGPEALKAVSAESRAEILSLFPELADLDYRSSPSRHLVKGCLGAKLAIRHARNNKPLLEISED